jgi:AcrR family transcriptional regulator
MENKYRRKKEPEENKKLILESGIQLIMEVGLDNFTLDAVAKKANISKGGVLHHFHKKDILMEEMFKSCLSDFKESIQREQYGNEISSPVAYLFAAIKAEPSKEYVQVLKVLFQNVLQNERYQSLMGDWYRENVVADIEQSSPKEAMAVLLADGLLLALLSGAFTISILKKDQILNFIQNLNNNE